MLKIASKAQMASMFFGKNISFPLNPLSACPKSRCNLITGVSNTTVTTLLSGVPLFDLFTKMGVKLGLGTNQLLTFDITKLNKVSAATLCSEGTTSGAAMITLQQ
jgi:hypothetical protein